MDKMIHSDEIDCYPRPKLFDEKFQINKVAHPSDTQYLNYGISRFRRRCIQVLAVIISILLTYYGLKLMITLYKMLLNKDLLFVSNDRCHEILGKYNNDKFSLEKEAKYEVHELLAKDKGKGYGLSFWLIAKDGD